MHSAADGRCVLCSMLLAVTVSQRTVQSPAELSLNDANLPAMHKLYTLMHAEDAYSTQLVDSFFILYYEVDMRDLLHT